MSKILNCTSRLRARSNGIQHLILIAGLICTGILSLGVVSLEELEATKPQLEVTQAGNNLIIDWAAHPEVYYFMEGTYDLVSGNWVTAKLLKDNVASGSLSLGTVITGSRAFYRLRLEGDPDSASLRADDDGDGIINILEVEAGWDAFATEDQTDSDNDGIPDYFEQFHFNTLSHDASYVAVTDGLTLAEAFANATDPNSADSDGDGFTDAYEIANGLDPNYNQSRDNKTLDTDGDGLTDFQESEIGTRADQVDTDNDGVDDGLDGWALDDGLAPPRLPNAKYAVIDTNMPGYELLDMNNSGELLLHSTIDGTIGVWAWGQFTTLDQADAYYWHSINDAGVVVGHTGPGYGALYTIEPGGSAVKEYDYYLPGTPYTAPEDHSNGNGVEWLTPHIDASGSIYACIGGGVYITPEERLLYSIGPLKIAGGAITELAGYMSFDASIPFPPLNDTMIEIKAASSAGILLGASWNDADKSLVVEGSTKTLLSATAGSNPSSIARDISDGTSPFVIGNSGGDLAIWNKINNNWTRIYDPQDAESSKINGTGYAINSNAEIVGVFNDAEGRTGPLVRNGRIIELDSITDEYTFDGYYDARNYSMNENGMFTYVGRKVGEDVLQDRLLLLLKVDLDPVYGEGPDGIGYCPSSIGDDLESCTFVGTDLDDIDVGGAINQIPNPASIVIESSDNDGNVAVFKLKAEGITDEQAEDLFHWEIESEGGSASFYPSANDNKGKTVKVSGTSAGRVRLNVRTSSSLETEPVRYIEANVVTKKMLPYRANVLNYLNNPNPILPLDPSKIQNSIEVANIILRQGGIELVASSDFSEGNTTNVLVREPMEDIAFLLTADDENLVKDVEYPQNYSALAANYLPDLLQINFIQNLFPKKIARNLCRPASNHGGEHHSAAYKTSDKDEDDESLEHTLRMFESLEPTELPTPLPYPDLYGVIVAWGEVNGSQKMAGYAIAHEVLHAMNLVHREGHVTENVDGLEAKYRGPKGTNIMDYGGGIDLDLLQVLIARGSPLLQ